MQDWTQEESHDSPSPYVGADPPTSPRYAAVDAVLFISCLMQEVLRQRSVARLCALHNIDPPRPRCAPPALQSRPRAPHLHPLGIPSHLPACLQEFFSLTLSLPLPPSQALGGQWCAGTRLADRRARHPVGPFPRLWAVWARSLREGSACTLFGCVACSCARVGCVLCRRPFNVACVRLPVRASRCGYVVHCTFVSWCMILHPFPM